MTVVWRGCAWAPALSTGTAPVAILQLDTSGHLQLVTYNGGTGTSHATIAPGLLVQRITHGIVQGHRSTFVPGLIERFGGQYRADRLHLARVGDAMVDRPCATDLLSQRMGCAPQPGSAPWRRRRRSDASKPFQ